jgi:hypothetical protein
VNLANDIEDCKNDVKIAGSHEWAASALENLKATCVQEFEMDTDLLPKDKNGDPVDSPPAVVDQTCPDDCNGRGACVQGSCACSDDFVGPACDLKKDEKPELDGVEWCDASVQSCAALAVQGQRFIESKNLKCHFQEIEVNLDTGKFEKMGGKSEKEAKFDNEFQVRCPNPDPESKRSYLVAVSNDGSENLQDAMPFVSFNGKCHKCSKEGEDAKKVKCERVYKSACYIDSICYDKSVTSPSDACLHCDPGVNRNEWTSVASNACATTNFPVVTVVLVIVVIVAIFAGVLLMMRETHKQNRLQLLKVDAINRQTLNG